MRGLAPTLDGMADLDPYRVLGLEPEPGLSEAVIKKAYRKKALVLHPDKRAASEREKAQREFDQLQKAYDILLDPEARAALENLAKARGEPREAEQQEAKRRKLREDLEARERAAERGKNEEEEAKERLKAELARLRRDFATRKRAYDRETAATTTPEEPVREAFSPADVSRAVPEHLYRTLKVAWRRDASNYPAKRLRDVYAQFGTVEDVVIREGKKKKGKRAGGIHGSRDGGASRLGAGGRRRKPAARRSSRRPAAGMGPRRSEAPGEKIVTWEKRPRGRRRGHPRGCRRGVVYSRAASPRVGVCFPADPHPRREAPPGASSRVPEGTWRIGITRAWCWIGCGARRRRRVS